MNERRRVHLLMPDMRSVACDKSIAKREKDADDVTWTHELVTCPSCQGRMKKYPQLLNAIAALLRAERRAEQSVTDERPHHAVDVHG